MRRSLGGCTRKGCRSFGILTSATNIGYPAAWWRTTKVRGIRTCHCYMQLDFMDALYTFLSHYSVLTSNTRDTLRTVHGMHRFRHFLFATEGDSSCIFWMDVERLKRAAGDPPTRDKILAKINSTFLNDGALFPLKHEVKQMVLSFRGSPSEGGNTSKGGSYLAARIRALSHVQLAALQSLRSYWLKRYVDSMTIQNVPCHVRRMSEACPLPTIAEGCPKGLHLPKIITVHDAMKDSRQPREVQQLCTASQRRLPPAGSCGRLLAVVSAGDVDKVRSVSSTISIL